MADVAEPIPCCAALAAGRALRTSRSRPSSAALEELFAALAPLRRKFSTNVEVNSEDMPPPYDEAPTVSRKAALLDEEDSEDEEGDEDEEEEVAEME